MLHDNDVPAYVYKADGTPLKRTIFVHSMLTAGAFINKRVQDIIWVSKDHNVNDTIYIDDTAYVVEAKDEHTALIRRLWF